MLCQVALALSPGPWLEKGFGGIPVWAIEQGMGEGNRTLRRKRVTISSFNPLCCSLSSGKQDCWTHLKPV